MLLDFKNNRKKFVIHTDGSCLGNPGPGGWAVIVCEEEEIPKELSGGYRLTTNNRMELIAVIEGLSSLDAPADVHVKTDSQYVKNAIDNGWLAKWLKNNWRNGTVANIDLWKRLVPLLEKHKVRISWVKGHSGHRGNEVCDSMAKNCARQTCLPADLGYEMAI